MENWELHLRLIEARDNNRIASIIREVMTAYDCVGEGYSIEDDEVDAMFEVYTLPYGKYFVVSDKAGTVYGGAGINILEGGDSSICELKKMYFLPAIRGKGWGRKILQSCLLAAKEMGYKQCYLETVDRMKEANALYVKMGFTQIFKSLGCTGHNSCDSYYVKNV